jgi:hypothetical protein
MDAFYLGECSALKQGCIKCRHILGLSTRLFVLAFFVASFRLKDPQKRAPLPSFSREFGKFFKSANALTDF